MSKSRIPRHATKEHLPHWLIQAAQDSSRIRIASPYVTSRRLLNRCREESIELYTDFSALSFVVGASSLRVLKSVIEHRSKVFHVPNLHAKVILVNDQLFSLGSQNLTTKGRTNVEASFISGSETPAAEVVAFFDHIQVLARAVTLEDIELMEKLVRPILMDFRDLRLRGDSIDQRIENERKFREAEAEKQREQQRQIREAAATKRDEEEAARKAQQTELKSNSENMALAVNKWRALSRKRNQELPLSIRSVVQIPPGAKSYSLVPADKRQSYLDLIRTKGLNPHQLSRYLMVNEADGRVAFARFSNGRISYYSDSLRITDVQALLGTRFQLTIRFDWTKVGLTHRTGWISIELEESPTIWVPAAEIDFIFAPDGLQLCKPRLSLDTKNPLVYLQKFKKLVQLSASAELREIIWKRLVEPFKFSKKLHGHDARRFFPLAHGDRFTLKAVNSGSSAVLVATSAQN